MNTRDARKLGRRLLDEHGCDDVPFDLDDARRRMGVTFWYVNGSGVRNVALSRHYVRLNDEPAVRCTILHEVAHVLAGRQDRTYQEPRFCHGPLWREIAIRIGSDGEEYVDHRVATIPSLPWRFECPGCGSTGERWHKIEARCAEPLFDPVRGKRSFLKGQCRERVTWHKC